MNGKTILKPYRHHHCVETYSPLFSPFYSPSSVHKHPHCISDDVITIDTVYVHQSKKIHYGKWTFNFFFFFSFFTRTTNWFDCTSIDFKIHAIFFSSVSFSSIFSYLIHNNQIKPKDAKEKNLSLFCPAWIQSELRKLSASGSSLSLSFIR